MAESSNVGQHVLRRLVEACKDSEDLPRIAFKMATGTGKTVVMAALIVYHFFNRQEYRADTRFADNFLIVAPGVTIRDRLGVLHVDTRHQRSTDAADYYRERFLVPPDWDGRLVGLNARLVIINRHQLEARLLQGNKKSPFDGKRDSLGGKREAREDPGQMLKRVTGRFKPGSRLLVINDEAHHCYLPRERGRSTEGEDSRTENERAAIWFTGLRECCRRFKVRSIYDLSATPYYLTGSGYTPYSLFSWVVSDFGLIEAIESGLVKIPFLPERDNTQQLDMPVLKNLYEHIKTELNQKGAKARRAEARESGFTVQSPTPQLPTTLKLALEQFYHHYERDYETYRGLFDSPPVFIVVCNNVSVSREVYQHIAGYEKTLPDGSVRGVAGQLKLLSNYDEHSGRALLKPPTLLIDSDALEQNDQIDEDFKRVFAEEIRLFKEDYARIHGAGSAETITDAQLLREVVNTVGKPGMLGGHIRCVVSVSMLTEGWDANTVTHIVGVRAFGSQLLCEQVAGRALRRKRYVLQGYDKEGRPTSDPRRIRSHRFPPEYAHIIGVPFKLFKGGVSVTPEAVDQTLVQALPERQELHEIRFPRVRGYRIDQPGDSLTADFRGIEPFIIGPDIPTVTTMATAFDANEHVLDAEEQRALRHQQVIYRITHQLLDRQYRDAEGSVEYHRFGQLKEIVRQWYEEHVVAQGDCFKQLLWYFDPATYLGHLLRAIQSGSGGERRVLPLLQAHDPIGSTAWVRGRTSRPVFPTTASHVNVVVADTKSWEQITAKTLEELAVEGLVISYVKNAFLGFAIPYLKESAEHQYFPDFIVRCRRPDGRVVSLILEISGFSQEDKALKAWTVREQWLPAVATLCERYELDEWDFLELTQIETVKNRLREWISGAPRA